MSQIVTEYLKMRKTLLILIKNTYLVLRNINYDHDYNNILLINFYFYYFI